MKNGFIDDGLQGIRLGVVALFGIVVPGVWFWATSVFYLSYMFGSESLADLQSAAKTAEAQFGPYLALTVGFIVI